jgi:hypothetical protein
LQVAAVVGMATRARAETQVYPLLKITAEQRYDDDALLSAPTGPGPALSKVSPQVGFTAEDATLTSEAWYAADLQYRSRSSDFATDHRGSFELKNNFSKRTYADIALKFWRTSDPTALPRTGIARSLSPILYGRADVTGQHRISERWSLRMGYRFEGVRLTEAVVRHGYVHSPFAEIWRAVSKRTDWGLQYRFSAFVSDVSPADAHAAAIQVRHRLTPTMQMHVRVGPLYYRDRSGIQGVAPWVHLQIDRQMSGFDIGLQLGHDVVGASGFATALWADYASLYAGIPLGRRVKLTAGASAFRNGKPPNEDWERSFSSASVSSGYALGAGLEWNLNQNVAMQLGVDRISQIAAPELSEGVNLDRNIASARIIVTALGAKERRGE